MGVQCPKCAYGTYCKFDPILNQCIDLNRSVSLYYTTLIGVVENDHVNKLLEILATVYKREDKKEMEWGVGRWARKPG